MLATICELTVQLLVHARQAPFRSRLKDAQNDRNMVAFVLHALQSITGGTHGGSIGVTDARAGGLCACFVCLCGASEPVTSKI